MAAVNRLFPCEYCMPGMSEIAKPGRRNPKLSPMRSRAGTPSQRGPKVNVNPRTPLLHPVDLLRRPHEVPEGELVPIADCDVPFARDQIAALAFGAGGHFGRAGDNAALRSCGPLGDHSDHGYRNRQQCISSLRFISPVPYATRREREARPSVLRAAIQFALSIPFRGFDRTRAQ